MVAEEKVVVEEVGPHQQVVLVELAPGVVGAEVLAPGCLPVWWQHCDGSWWRVDLLTSFY